MVGPTGDRLTRGGDAVFPLAVRWARKVRDDPERVPCPVTRQAHRPDRLDCSGRSREDRNRYAFARNTCREGRTRHGRKTSVARDRMDGDRVAAGVPYEE